MATDRNPVFDLMKGLAIFFVVMGHVLTYGIGKVESSIVFRLIGVVHMPLFFFISGYFCMKIRDGRFVLPDMWRRTLQLLVPMAAVSTLWIWYYPHSGLMKYLTCTFPGLWSDLWKNGYWFTPVLFCLMAIYALCALVSNRLPWRHSAVGVFVAAFAALVAADVFIPEETGKWLSLPFVMKYFPVFTFGGWWRAHSSRCLAAARSQWGYTSVFTAVVALTLYILYPGDIYSDTFTRTAAHILLQCSLAVLALVVCSAWCEASAASGRETAAIRFWTYLGRNSLSIYLLHYFFLFPLGDLRHMLRGMALDFVPVALTAAFVALPVIGVSLAVSRIVGLSRPLAILFTGKV